MSDRRARLALLGGLVALLTIAGPNRAGATIKYGPFQLSGSLQSQNLIRHPDIDSYNITQQRNTARLQLEYKWLENGRFIDKYDIPFISRSSLYVLYRGVYDSFYDFTPGYIEKSDVHGKVYNGQDLFDFANVKGNALGRPKFARNTLTVSGMTHGERDALKFDNQLREAYIDLKMRDIPLSVRAGRQQIVWGETDNFRMLDRVNPLTSPGTSSSSSRRPPSAGTRSAARCGCSSSSTTWATSGSSPRTTSSGTGTRATGIRRSRRSCPSPGASASSTRSPTRSTARSSAASARSRRTAAAKS
jgi:hypothetical protein